MRYIVRIITVLLSVVIQSRHTIGCLESLFVCVNCVACLPTTDVCFVYVPSGGNVASIDSITVTFKGELIQ